MSDAGEETPKIHIDSDWKAEAQAEKERLKAMEAEQEAAGGPGGEQAMGELPPPNWETLVGMMATQAILYLGGIADPRTGQPILDLDAARHQIELLGVLEEKTKGNLSEEEEKQLSTLLYDLRMRYVQIAQALSNAGGPGGPGDPAGGGGGPGTPPIVTG